MQTRLTRVDERKVHDQEANSIWQQAKRSDQQRPEVQALEAAESREDEQQQFESIVDGKRASNCDKDRRDIIVAREESSRVVQFRERDLEAHGDGGGRRDCEKVVAQPLSRMPGPGDSSSST